MGNKKSTPMERRTRKLTKEYTPLLRELSSSCQKHTVLKHLMQYGNITQEQAIDLYRVYRLSGRISELRQRGVNIITIMMDNRYNNGKHAKYVLDFPEKKER